MPEFARFLLISFIVLAVAAAIWLRHWLSESVDHFLSIIRRVFGGDE